VVREDAEDLHGRPLAAAGGRDIEGVELGSDLAQGGGAGGLNLGDCRQDLRSAAPCSLRSHLARCGTDLGADTRQPSSFVPRAFAAASADLVRLEMALQMLSIDVVTRRTLAFR
jgi:hypothetical protein